MDVNGADLRGLPLSERLHALDAILPASSAVIVKTVSVTARGCELFDLMCSHDLEGVVAKRLADPYNSRVRRLKIKNRDYSQAEGRADLFNRPSADSEMKYTGPPATLGSSAAAQEIIIVWCRDPDCLHQVKHAAAEQAARYGADMPVRDWVKRLVCSQCGSRRLDFYLTKPDDYIYIAESFLEWLQRHSMGECHHQIATSYDVMMADGLPCCLAPL